MLKIALNFIYMVRLANTVDYGDSSKMLQYIIFSIIDVHYSATLFMWNFFLYRKFDIRWIAPKAEGSFSDARGDIIISHDCIIVNSSSVAFELNTKVKTSYYEEYWLNRKDFLSKNVMPFVVEGIELDLRMRGFEFFSMVSSYPFDSPKPINMKATGRIKFQGKVLKSCSIPNGRDLSLQNHKQELEITDKGNCLAGEVMVSGLKLNQLTLAPQLAGLLSISRDSFKVL